MTCERVNLVLQRADADEAEHVLVKEECSEDDLWKNNPENRLSECVIARGSKLWLFMVP